MITVYALPGQLSPALGPILGAICDQFLDWRWTFWIVSIVSVALQVLCFATVRETYQPVLDRRWERQLSNDEKSAIKWWQPSKGELADTKRKLAISTQRPFKMLATHPIVQLIALSNGLTYGIQMLVTASLDQLWRKSYHQPTILAALNYLALGVGLVVGAQICRHCNRAIYARLKARNDGQGCPEFRIPMIAVGTAIVPIGLLWYGWSAQARVFPLVPDLGVFLLAIGLVAILNCTSLYLVDTYKLQSASATGAVNLLRSIAGFAFPLFSTALYDRLGQGYANTLLAGITIVAGWPVPFLLWRYGAKMRRGLVEQ